MASDLDKLQGTWNVKSLEADGKKMPAVAFNGAHLVIRKNTFTSVGMGATYEGALEMDPGQHPKTFDLLFTAGPEKGNRNLGIYKLDGDRWTICLATRGTQRPASFATKPNTGFMLEILERSSGAGAGARTRKKSQSQVVGAVSAAKITAPPVSVESGAPTELEGDWEMLSGVFNGAAMDKAMVKWCTRTIRGNVTTVVAGPQVFLTARFTLDPSKRPPAIDYVNLEGANRGKSQAGIFDWSGDTLKICMAAPGGARPGDFASAPGDGRSYTTWRRAR